MRGKTTKYLPVFRDTWIPKFGADVVRQALNTGKFGKKGRTMDINRKDRLEILTELTKAGHL